MAAIVSEWAQELEQHEIFMYALPIYQSLDMLALSGTVLWQRKEEKALEQSKLLSSDN